MPCHTSTQMEWAKQMAHSISFIATNVSVSVNYFVFPSKYLFAEILKFVQTWPIFCVLIMRTESLNGFVLRAQCICSFRVDFDVCMCFSFIIFFCKPVIISAIENKRTNSSLSARGNTSFWVVTLLLVQCYRVFQFGRMEAMTSGTNVLRTQKFVQTFWHETFQLLITTMTNICSHFCRGTWLNLQQRRNACKTS